VVEEERTRLDTGCYDGIRKQSRQVLYI
jgi:hypothetical protein